MIKSVKVVKEYHPKIYFHLKDDITEKDIRDMVFFILDVSNGKVDIRNSYIYIYYEFENENDFKEVDSFVFEIINEIGEVIREDYKNIMTSWTPKFEVKIKEIDMNLKRAYYELFLKWIMTGIFHVEDEE